MRADMKQNYDYTLIDSRTGLSDVADIRTVELPDILVVCFTLNDQSIEGASNVARQIRGRYHDRNIQIFPVPMRIENAEKDKLEIGLAFAKAKFEGFPVDLLPEEAAHYWSTVEIPYRPFYAFEETLAALSDAPGSQTSLLAAYERIADKITAGEVSSMPAMDEELRLRYCDAYTRRQPISSTEVLLSYSPEDQMWAEWIKWLLGRSGLRVQLKCAVAGDGAEDIAKPQPENMNSIPLPGPSLCCPVSMQSPGSQRCPGK